MIASSVGGTLIRCMFKETASDSSTNTINRCQGYGTRAEYSSILLPTTPDFSDSLYQEEHDRLREKGPNITWGHQQGAPIRYTLTHQDFRCPFITNSIRVG